MTATVAGHPVYTFSGDQNPGDVNGEGLAGLRRHLVRRLAERQRP